jgi:MoaA/NifB/PqqE/SkfB family radical SAM enzyme
MNRHRVTRYLSDPFLYRLMHEVREAGPIRSISVDLTHACNLRCTGCYFFAENMNARRAPDDPGFADFIARERARGTNYVTIIGGEPSLQLDRLKLLHDSFHVMTVTNGLRPIPRTDFENMPIAVSVWGDSETDRKLRGANKLDVFARALANYRDDPRVTWYFTVSAGSWHEIERVTERCIENGNYMSFNFYGDLAGIRGEHDHRAGFDRVRREIDRMIARYPERILLTSYLNQVISTGRMLGEAWGYDVCASITSDHPVNHERIHNGNLYNPHFRAYTPDLTTTRRCCVGEERDCSTCFDVWSHTAWVMLNLDKHLASFGDFTNWLTAVYLFYLANRIVDFDAGIRLLPEIHHRVSESLAREE